MLLCSDSIPCKVVVRIRRRAQVVITTVLTPACAANLPTSSGVTCSSCMWRSQPSLLRFRHCLPGDAVALHQPDHVIGAGHFGHQHVSTLRKVNDRVRPAGVAGEQERTVQCVEKTRVERT